MFFAISSQVVSSQVTETSPLMSIGTGGTSLAPVNIDIVAREFEGPAARRGPCFCLAWAVNVRTAAQVIFMMGAGVREANNRDTSPRGFAESEKINSTRLSRAMLYGTANAILG